MNADRIFSIFMTLALVAFATTLVLPGRQTAQVIGASTSGLSDVTRASLGMR
jgi:hypothetical protein